MLAEPKAVRDPRGAGAAELLARVARCRQAAAGLDHPERHFSLQAFDLSRIRLRFGPRWHGLRPHAVELIRAGLARELAQDELQLDTGGDLLLAIRAASDRRVIERHGELLAAEVTARLCGTIPTGAIVRVATQPFDPALGLAGDCPEEVAAALVRHILGRAGEGAGGAALRPECPAPRFSPVLHLRKRLVSAYRLSSPDPALADDLWAVETAHACLGDAAGGRAPALIVPVHYATLAEMRAREAHLRTLRQLPERSRRRLVHEVLDLPERLPQARARELLAYLRPMCLALVVRSPAPASDLDHLAHSGAHGVSLAAPAADEASASALRTFAGRARIGGLRSLLLDITDPEQCRLALQAGLDHLGGEALLPAMPRLGRAFMVARGR
ncbi:MAG: hypothetical protein AB7I59_16845 [Geminicoccaceae bacterium]